jgi:hypothetical protein
MLRTLACILLGLGLNSSAALAEDAAPAAPAADKSEASKVASKGEAPEKTGRLSSSEIRATKTYGVYLEPFGYTMTPATGLRGEYLLSEDNVLSFGVVSGAFDSSALYSNSSSSMNEFTKLLTEIRFKRFIGNSFYAAAGLGIERWTINYHVSKKGSETEDVTLVASNTNIGPTIHVGNQWTWKYVSVGVDWAGYLKSLSTSFTAGDSDDAETDDKESAEKYIRGMTYGSSLHVVRVYVGTMF